MVVAPRNCPAIHLVPRELYTIFKHLVLHYAFAIHDGEREFDAVEGCADGREFNQGPKTFRMRIRMRDQRRLDAYLAEDP